MLVPQVGLRRLRTVVEKGGRGETDGRLSIEGRTSQELCTTGGMRTVRVAEGGLELRGRGARDDVIVEPVHPLIVAVVGSFQRLSDQLRHHDQTDLVLDEVPEHNTLGCFLGWKARLAGFRFVEKLQSALTLLLDLLD